jgi:hypothetical protein
VTEFELLRAKIAEAAVWSEVIGSSKNGTRDVVPHNITRASLCRPEGRFTKPLFGLPQQSLYSFPDPQGHLSLGFGMEHLQLLASYTEHYTFRVSACKKFHGTVKKEPDLWNCASRRTRAYAHKAGSEIGNESSVVHAQHDKLRFKVSRSTNC